MVKNDAGGLVKNVKKIASCNNVYRGMIGNNRFFYDSQVNFLGARIKNNKE